MHYNKLRFHYSLFIINKFKEYFTFRDNHGNFKVFVVFCDIQNYEILSNTLFLNNLKFKKVIPLKRKDLSIISHVLLTRRKEYLY